MGVGLRGKHNFICRRRITREEQGMGYLDIVVHACSLSYVGGRGGRIAIQGQSGQNRKPDPISKNKLSVVVYV
jgi:hypothetical protein